MVISQRISTIGVITLLLIGSLLLTPLSPPLEARFSEEYREVSPRQDRVSRGSVENYNIISNINDDVELRDHMEDPFRENDPWDRETAFWNESTLPERLRINHPRHNLTIPPATGIPHDRIRILSDADFVSQGWPGAGTPTDPYRIENLDINETSGTYCIKIHNTRAHFIIYNCTLYGASNDMECVNLHNVSNGLILNNTIYSYETCTRLNASSWNIIYNNTITSRWGLAIYMNLSPNNSIINNTCDGGYYGITLSYSDNNRLVNNTCHCSIRTYKSSNITIYANILYDGEFDYMNSSRICDNQFEYSPYIYCCFSNTLTQNNFTSLLLLYSSGNNSITHNSFLSDGIMIYGSLETARQFLVQNNIVRQKPLEFWQDQVDGTIPLGAGQIILVNCTGTIVSNQTLTNSSRCIQILYSQLITVQNNTCTLPDYGVGIRLYHTNSSQILNNTCTGQGYYGSYDGIILDYSIGNVIKYNNCSRNNYGISVYRGSLNRIINNTLTENWYFDIRLSYSGRNTLTNNTADQTYLWLSDSNIITSNHLGRSRSSSLYISRAINNTICNNQFINGGLYLSFTDFTLPFRQWLVADNTVNGKSLIYLEGQVGGDIPNNVGQIVLVNCTEMIVSNHMIGDCIVGIQLLFSRLCHVVGNTLTGSGIQVTRTNSTLVEHNTCTGNSGNGIYVSGLNITIYQNTCSENSYDGILVYGGNHTIYQNTCCFNEERGLNCRIVNSLIYSNVLNHNRVGLEIGYGDNTIFVDNICTHNIYAGIYVIYMEKSFVANNICCNNRWGIQLYSCGGIISGNNCSHNTEHGIYQRYSSWNSYLSIIQNDCFNNTQDGIHGRYSSNTYFSRNDCYENGRYGICIFRGYQNNTVKHNWCLNNGRDGIGLDRNSNSSITYNVCSGNRWYGISLNSTCTNNTVMWNVFAVNGAANGFDNGSLNVFDFNFWSDYLGTDWNFDGIGDTPYVVDGPQGSRDFHPLLQWPGGLVVSRAIITGAVVFVCIIVSSVMVVMFFLLRRQRIEVESTS